MAEEQPAEAAYVRLMTPAVKYWVCKTRAGLPLRGDGVPRRQRLRRGERAAAALSRGAGQRDLGGLRQRHGARRGARAERATACSSRCWRRSAASSGRARRPRSTCSPRRRAWPSEDEGSARILVEQLALTAAAAALRRDFPPAFADAFIETRLGRPWRATYGMIDGRFDARALVDYIAPAIG